uniref:Uncharacterized protein n=1 Tax=Hyaloperonospora arabidopsidis (strain Emoy2) TaxID=559515 RepID=M4BKI4_HYAAE
MASRTITRCRGARGQLVLYNPHTRPKDVLPTVEGAASVQKRVRDRRSSDPAVFETAATCHEKLIENQDVFGYGMLPP